MQFLKFVNSQKIYGNRRRINFFGITMNANRNFSFECRWLVVLAWICVVSSFSFATPVPPCPINCNCTSSGSGLRKASCTDPRWYEISYPNIHILVLRPSDVHSQCDVPEQLSLLFPQLNSISLRNCSLTDIPAGTFRHLKSLQVVNLSHNFITTLSKSLFVDNSKLRFVNLENNPLELGSHPLLWSDTVWEMNLARCNLSGRLPSNTFARLPNLRYLSLADNKLETIPENSLPRGLKRLDLSGNSIVNVPLSELHRLKGLKEIDISRNPVDCTCQLMGFQNWVSGEGTIFRNQIQCATPVQYAGISLVDVPQSELCYAKQDQQLLSNQVQPENLREGFDEAVDDDHFLFNVEIGRLVGEESKHRHSRRSASQPEFVEGSGNGEDVEGSGDFENASTNKAEIIITSSSEPKESTPASVTAANSTEVSISSEPTSKAESSVPPTTTPSTSEDSSSQPVTVESASGLSNTSKGVSPDAGITTPEKEPESTEPSSTGNGEETTPSPTTVTSESTSASPSSSSAGGSSDSSTSTEASSATSPANVVASGLPNSTDEPEGVTTVRDAVETEVQTESLTPSQAVQEEQRDRRKGSPLRGSAMPGGTADEDSTSTTVDDSETTISVAGEKNDSANSTGQPIQGQMTKNETIKSATSTPYIIPSLLIVAVALVCVAVYFSQHNCRHKSWSRNGAKANGAGTELQDVSLLKPEARRPELYSKRYEAEGQNPQTEKLTNGDCELPPENGCSPASQPLPKDDVPAVKKSTTRVTTNYESLPKTPIIIQKS